MTHCPIVLLCDVCESPRADIYAEVLGGHATNHRALCPVCARDDREARRQPPEVSRGLLDRR